MNETSPIHQAWILSSGSELTAGRSLDTNGPWLARQLAELGIETPCLLAVSDDGADLERALRHAAEHTELIIMTGGLGPTEDDLTRDVLARLAGVPLELDAACLETMRAFFAERNWPMPNANRVQAMLPRGATALPNRRGTAPGIFIEIGRTACYALPGVPHEMEEMFRGEVAPRVRERAGGQAVLHRCLRTFGRPEADLGEQLRDLMRRGANPSVGVTAAGAMISVSLTATAPSRVSAEALAEATAREVRARLGDTVFGEGDDTLASTVGKLLVARGQTLCTAESCTGGLVGKLLTDTPGSSRYYLGGVVTYANEAKERLLGVPESLLREHGAVSRPVAEHMARAARETFGSDYALSITGVAGPDGGTAEKPVGLVYFGLAGPGGVDVRELRLGPTAPRELIRLRSARGLLNLLRRELLRGG
ncbi:MAG: competence/damage-inducible protein A [Phycisphaerae bacterium]|jgi:nicotinamide-nucleotide amidase